MAHILRVKAQWSGFQGAPGLSVFHFGAFDVGAGWVPADSQSAADRLRTFFNSCGTSLPPGASVTVLGEVEVLEDTTGDLVEIHGITAPTPVPGNGGATGYASAVGAVINWKTNQVRKGRRIRGRTFMVPLAGDQYEGNGTLKSTAISTINTAATTLRTSTGKATLGVYGRPTGKDATDGIFALASANSVPDMGAVLRSRRD
jgi:hypothetical protein